MAEQSPNQLPGDVVLVLQQAKHPRFTRKGNDLHMGMKISLKEALLGFSRDIVHLDGHKVELKYKKVTSPGEVFRVNREGMPFKDDPTQFGNLFVKMEIVMPKGELNAEKRNLVEQLFPEKGSGRTEL